MPLTEQDTIRIRQFIQRLESGLILGQQVFVAYHDSNLAATPSDPTGNGTTGGWHRLATEASNWMSVKTALSDSQGTWGTPIRVFGLQGTETAGVGTSDDVPKLVQIKFIGDGASKVGWTAGTVEYGGNSYAIAVKAVGDGSTDAYIYWDDADGQTSFKTTASLATAIAANHWYVCRNDSGVATPAESHRIILGGLIQAATITASTAIIANTVTSSELATAVNNDIAQGIADAATAQAELDEIAADDKVTPVEKLAAKQLWDAIVVEGHPATGTIPIQATAFGITFTVGWLGINSSHIVSSCGDNNGNTLAKALDGTGYWSHEQQHTHQFEIDLGARYEISNFRGRSLASYDPIDIDIYVRNEDNEDIVQVVTGLSTWQDTSSWVEVAPSQVLSRRFIFFEINTTEDGTFNFLSFGNNFTIFDAYGGISDFDLAYQALNLYLNATIDVFGNMATTTTMVRADWDTAWKNYYDERTQLLNAIATEAKDRADAAQSDADAKIKTFFQDAVPTAENAGDIWYDTNDGQKMHRATSAGDDQVTAGEWEHVDLTIIDGGNITASTILAASIGTYNLTAANATFENLVVKTAHIDNLNVTTGKLANLGTTTGKLENEATGVSEQAHTAGEVTLNAAQTTIQTLSSIDTDGDPITLRGSFNVYNNDIVAHTNVVTFYEGANLLATRYTASVPATSWISASVSYSYTPTSGSKTYYLKAARVAVGDKVAERTFTLVSDKGK